MDSQRPTPVSPDSTLHYGAIRRQNLKKRSNRVIMTTEAKTLKQIREERKQKLGERNFSLRAVAKRLGKTDSWLAQIENGRADVPQDERLDALLDIYGLKRKSFNERVRLFKEKVTPKSELQELVERISDSQANLILTFTKSILSQS